MLEKLFRDFDFETTDKNVKMVKEIHKAAEEIIDTAVRLGDSIKDLMNEKESRRVINSNVIRSSRKVTRDVDDYDYDDEQTSSRRRRREVPDVIIKKSSRRLLNDTDDIETIADVLDYVSSIHKVDITYGLSEPNTNNIVFAFSPRVNIMKNKFSESFTLDFNVDANNIAVKKASLDKIVDAFDAFVYFVLSMIEFSSSKYFDANFQNGSLCIQIDKDLSIHAGLVALIVKALHADGDEGFTFKVGNYSCKVKGKNLLISSIDGGIMSSIPLTVFDDLYESIPFLKDIEISSSLWARYQDNPDGLIVKIVLALLNEEGGHVLDKKDLKTIDTLVESGMCSLVLGDEIEG